MTVQEFLKRATQQLEAAGVGTARLDCLVIMEDVTGINRAQLLAHPEREVTHSQLKQLKQLIEQRARHIPLSHVRGKTEFYGREFVITPAVLEPRPESETMIELFKKLAAEDQALYVVDVGTGSGAIGITAALERPHCQVTLTDIDQEALKVAEQNCARFELDLACVADNLLAHAGKRGAQIDLILANLPYVPDHYEINTAALHEPRIAIFGGTDGLDLYRRLFEQCRVLRPRFVFTEALPFQHEELAAIAKQHGYRQLAAEDFIQVFTSDHPVVEQTSSAAALPVSP